GRRIRRIGADGHRIDDAAAAPAEEDVGLHLHEAPQLADLPDAILLHEAVVEGRDLPPALLLVGLAQHAQLDAAGVGLVAAGQDGDDDIVLHAVVELAMREASRADAVQPAAHAGLAAPDALAADLDHAVVGEQ